MSFQWFHHRVGCQPLDDVLHSSYDPSELLEWSCHADSTVDIVVSRPIIITIIIIIII